MRRLHVDRMLDELTPQEFDEWMAAYLVDPWGEERDDLRSAHHTALLLYALGAEFEVKDVFDYMANHGQPAEEYQSPNAQAQYARMLFGG